jgi:xylulokinase
VSGDLVLGVDCSTTACKAIVWDAEGRARAEGRSPIALLNPGPDAYEQDAEHWWVACGEAIGRAATALSDAERKCIRALCITHQRETFVVTDEASKPLHRALVWMDARCREAVKRAVARVGAERLHAISGKPACTTPSLYKLLFLLEEAAKTLPKQRLRVLDVHAFLAWRLTGRCATSLASADPLGLVDMQARSWSDELLALAGLDRSNVPELLEPGAAIGVVTESAARHCGIAPGLPVVAGAGDGQAAGLGAGIVGPGRAYLNLGTAIVSGVLAGNYAVDPAFRTLYAATPGSYFLETDLKGGTFTLSWLAEKWLRASDVDRALAELEARAETLPAGSDGLMLVPYWNAVMNPYWDDDATGIAIGWHGAHEPAHLYRAILEGIAFEQRLHSSGVEKASGQAIREFVVMGGGSKSALWCRILADTLGKRMVRAATPEATALGAGILAAVAAGVHPDLGSAISAMTSTGETVDPGPSQATYERLYSDVYVSLYPALQKPLARLAALRRSSSLDP